MVTMIIALMMRLLKRKAQKASIKKELMPSAWHPDRVNDWYKSEDKKRRWK